MAYLGRISHERTFKVGSYVIRLSPDSVLGIRRVGDRRGLSFFDLEDLMSVATGAAQFSIANAVQPHTTLDDTTFAATAECDDGG